MKKKTKQVVGELIYGLHPVIECLKAKRRKLITLYTTKPVPKAWSKIEKLMPKYPVNIQYVKRDVLAKMAGTTDHQGIVAWVNSFPMRKKFFEPTKQKFLLLLDSIQDPRNLGAILRSAYCTGVDGVIICQKDSAPLNAVAFKSSAGLAEHLEVYQAVSSAAAVQELQKAGYNLYLAALGGKKATDIQFNGPLCVVIGNEATGIKRQLLTTGTKVMLPQRTSDISYNASVAAGILLFSVATQQKVI